MTSTACASALTASTSPRYCGPNGTGLGVGGRAGGSHPEGAHWHGARRGLQPRRQAPGRRLRRRDGAAMGRGRGPESQPTSRPSILRFRLRPSSRTVATRARQIEFRCTPNVLALQSGGERGPDTDRYWPAGVRKGDRRGGDEERFPRQLSHDPQGSACSVRSLGSSPSSPN